MGLAELKQPGIQQIKDLPSIRMMRIDRNMFKFRLKTTGIHQIDVCCLGLFQMMREHPSLRGKRAHPVERKHLQLALQDVISMNLGDQRIVLNMGKKRGRVDDPPLHRNVPALQGRQSVPAPRISAARIKTHLRVVKPAVGVESAWDGPFQTPGQQVDPPMSEGLDRPGIGDRYEVQGVSRLGKRSLEAVDKGTCLVGANERTAIKQRDIQNRLLIIGSGRPANRRKKKADRERRRHKQTETAELFETDASDRQISLRFFRLLLRTQGTDVSSDGNALKRKIGR